MAKKLFYKLIKCKLCDNNYRYILDRKISKYICGGYARQLIDGCKRRHAIEEEEILYLVQVYCNRNKIELIEDNEFMKSIIDKIIVNHETDSLIVNYKNGESGIYNLNEIHI